MSAEQNHTPKNVDERFNHLEQRMADSQRQIAELSSQSKKILDLLGQLSPAHASGVPTEEIAAAASSPDAPSFVSRRSMLRNAALATLGAAAVWDTMPSAKASNSANYLNLGATSTASATTSLSSSVLSNAALSVTNTSSGSGIFGLSDASSSNVTPTTAGVSGSGNYAAGVLGTSVNSTGVVGTSSAYTGVSGTGGTYGGDFEGGLAPLILSASGKYVTPFVDTRTHYAGELFVDTTNQLWYCTQGTTMTTAAIWRKLAGNPTAGSFALLAAPTRFIDTRTSAQSPSSTNTPSPLPGSVVKTYIFSGNGALAPYVPPGTTVQSIPYGATALLARVTVLSGENGHTAVKGTLMVSNTNPASFGSGLISWTATPAIQGTPFIIALDNTTAPGSGQLYFTNTSKADTIDILVDVTGYYY